MRPRIVYSCSEPSARGSRMRGIAVTLDLERGHVDPAPLGPALQSELGQLHAFGAFEQVPLERRVVEQVPDEQFPFDLERVVVDLVVRHLLPAGEEIDRLRHVGIPHRLRRVDARLRPAVGQPGDRGAERAVDVKRDQVVAPHARRPRAVDLRDHRPVRAGELEGRVGGVVGRRLVFGLPCSSQRFGMCVAPRHETLLTSPNRLSST